MTAMGHQRRFGPAPTMSRLPPIADVETSVRRGREGPHSDIRGRTQTAALAAGSDQGHPHQLHALNARPVYSR
jgi:hypothetical protein